MNNKQIRALLFAGMGVTLAAVLVYALAPGNNAQGQPGAGTAGTPQSSNIVALPSAGGQTQIVLSQSGSTVTGPGASVSGDRVTVSRAGEYLITGSFQGQIYVEAEKEDAVVLRLAGVEIVNVSDAAIHVENAGTTLLWLEEGAENLLQSGTVPADGVLSAAADEAAAGGAVYARDDLTLAGEGSLRVLGYLNNGVQTSDDLVISGGRIAVEAVNNGVKGKDSVTVTGGILDIRAGGDGIKSDDDTGEGYGTVTISGGEFTIRAGGDAVQAETTLDITGGTFDIVTGGGGANAAFFDRGGWGGTDFGGGRGMGPGGMNGQLPPDTASGANGAAPPASRTAMDDNWDMEDEGQSSAKGLKSGVATTIAGGTFTIDSLDDAVHSNGDIIIAGGELSLASGDDGVHADGALTVRDGKLTVTVSYEGLEGNLITIEGGEIDVTARDDGINAYGGQNRMGGGFGGQNGKSTDTMPELTINGGSITVNADGDGLDSNGNLTVNGGFIIVNGPAGSGNGALDIGAENGGSAVVRGGTVLALGANGMAEGFGNGSTQCSFRYGLTNSFSAGDEIVILDDSGKEMIRHTAVKSGSSVVFTAPGLTQGRSYTLKAGDQTAEITLDSVSTVSGTGGSGFGGGFGGRRPDRGEMGGFGGQQPPDGMPMPPDGMPGRGDRQGMMGGPMGGGRPS